jgi:hypothetical protein
VEGNRVVNRQGTHPVPPVLGGAPVSPAAMVRAEVVKVRRMAVERAALVMDVRSILAVCWLMWIGVGA